MLDVKESFISKMDNNHFEKTLTAKCHCRSSNRRSWLTKDFRFFVVCFIYSSLTFTSGYGRETPDSIWSAEAEDFDSRNTVGSNSEYESCYNGEKLPGYTLRGGTKAGKYVNLGFVETFENCVDLCCQDRDCEIAVMLTFAGERKCFKVVCFNLEDDTCEPKETTSRSKYHPNLFLRPQVNGDNPKDLKIDSATTPTHETMFSNKGKTTCHHYTGSVCNTHVDPEMLYFYTDSNETNLDNRLRGPIQQISSTLSGKCRNMALQAICYRFYPQCADPRNPKQIKICESECDNISYGECSAEFASASMLSYLQRIIPNCQMSKGSETKELVSSTDCIHLTSIPYIPSSPANNATISRSTQVYNGSVNSSASITTAPSHVNSSSSYLVPTTQQVATSLTSITTLQPSVVASATIVNINDTDRTNFEELLASVSTTMVPQTTLVTMPTSSLDSFSELQVSAGDNTELVLPENHVSLYSSTWPKEEAAGEYLYKWSQLSAPANSHGYIEGENTKNVKLSKLDIAGLYTFKLEVTSKNKRHGIGYVNITVKEPSRVNRPPRANVNPKEQTITLPTSTVVLDGSKSTDDMGIVSYKWEEIKGPIKEKTVFGSATDLKILQLKNLVAGTYQFRLTVRDAEGEKDSVDTTVIVHKEQNYPPKANAGHDVIIQLPNNSVVLNGNQSTDDKSDLTFEWSKRPDSPACDMQGSDKSVLHVTRMTQGTYIFILKVTDASQLFNEAQVKVIVLPEHNTSPVAIAGDNKELVYPDDSTTLDGSLSRDNSKIVSYSWELESGPSKIKLVDANKARVHVTDLKPGSYLIKLTVKDDKGLIGTDTVKIHVKRDHNEPPVAIPGKDQVIYLPTRSVVLDGSQSHDDEMIDGYLWTRAGLSPAAGDVLNGSDRQAILRLANLVQGRYIFDLKVTDNKGVSSTASVAVIVNEDAKRMSLVEMYLDVDVNTFTEENKKQLLRKISVLLEVGKSYVVAEEIHTLGYGQGVVMIFYVNDPNLARMHDGKYIADLLKHKVGFGGKLFDFKMLKVDPYVCRNNCSQHGYCDKSTKQCVCDSFWTANVFKEHFGEKESNCEWSVLYLSVAVFAVFLFFIVVAWVTCFIFARRKRNRRRTRYRALRTHDPDGKEDILLVPKGHKGKYLAQSLTFTETDEDTEEETTVFDKKRLMNGHARASNGSANGKAVKQRDRAM